MAEPAGRSKVAEYGRDFCAWSDEQGRFLRARSAADLDRDNLAEELERLGNSGRSEIRNRMTALLVDLLKRQFQPGGRTNSWAAAILEQRRRIAEAIEESPSLKTFPSKVLGKEYRIARLRASGETGIDIERFPAESPYYIRDLLDENFFPGEKP